MDHWPLISRKPRRDLTDVGRSEQKATHGCRVTFWQASANSARDGKTLLTACSTSRGRKFNSVVHCLLPSSRNALSITLPRQFIAVPGTFPLHSSWLDLSRVALAHLSGMETTNVHRDLIEQILSLSDCQVASRSSLVAGRSSSRSVRTGHMIASSAAVSGMWAVSATAPRWRARSFPTRTATG